MQKVSFTDCALVPLFTNLLGIVPESINTFGTTRWGRKEEGARAPHHDLRT